MDNPGRGRGGSGRPVMGRLLAGGDEYIRQLCKNGDFPASSPSGDWFIREEDAHAWLEHWLDSGTGKRDKAG